MANFVERALLRAVLAANSQIRTSLRSLIQTITSDGFSESELTRVERHLIRVLTVVEAKAMPSDLPEPGAPLRLTKAQLATLHAVLGRFADNRLGAGLSSELTRAVSSGRIHLRS